MASRTFRDQNNNSKADSFFPLNINFNVYIDMDNRETKETNFVGRKA